MMSRDCPCHECTAYRERKAVQEAQTAFNDECRRILQGKKEEEARKAQAHLGGLRKEVEMRKLTVDPLPGTKEERERAITNQAEHKSTGKPPLAILPRAGLEGVAQVMAFGAKKYDLHNWRKGSSDIEFLNSTVRHIYKYLDGEDLDDESGLHHLAHATCDLMFILQWIADGILEDKRYKRVVNRANISPDPSLINNPYASPPPKAYLF